MGETPILPRLEALPRARVMPNGSWRACCPVHQDSTPSLDWRLGDDGRVLLTCRAGCVTEDVVAALGCTMADLFVPEREGAPPPRRSPVVATTDYAIRDAQGILVAIHRRRDRADSSKTLIWLDATGRTGLDDLPVASLPLYGTERVAGWDTARPIVIVEGEKAADALLAAGRQALGTVTGAAVVPDRSSLAVVDGFEVLLSPDNDLPGRQHMAAIATGLAGVPRRVRWLDPAGWPDKADLADILAPGHTAAQLHGLVEAGDVLAVPDAVTADINARIGDVPEGADRTDTTGDVAGSVRSVPADDGDGDGWPDIEPLTADAPLPPFPIGALPAWMGDMAIAVAANTETDLPMAALTTLGMASVPLSNRFTVATPTWSERGVNLFTVCVADSGELKSAVFAALDEPLRRHELDTIAEEAPDLLRVGVDRKELQTRLQLAKDGLKAAMKAEILARSKADDEADEKVQGALRAIGVAREHLRSAEHDLAQDADQESKPYALLADDSTPEALQRQMAQQDGRVGIVSPESELFLMAAGRYSDKGPSLQVYLSGFSGDPMRGDRITREAPPVEHPGLAIVIATQPVILEDARRNQYLQRRGLMARCLYAVPASRAGSRHLADRPSVPGSVAREYRDTLMRLCRLGDAESSAAPVVLHIRGEALQRLVRWHDEVLEPRRDRFTGDLGSTEAMAAWAGRLHGVVVRIAGVLHVARHLGDAATTAIEPSTVDDAIAIGEWAIEHAHAAFGIERLDGTGHDAMRVRRWYRAREGSGPTFSVRDATRGLRGIDAERIRTALRRLEEHGYVRVERRKPGPEGGRPTEIVHIHPDDQEHVA